MAGFDVLDPHLNLFQNRFLEASAGTGKTFAIENIVTRLLKENIPLERILIVTFTKAATSDLKTRIRKNIAKHQLQEALFKFDEAKIFTIHSFCFHSLREYALEANLSLEQEEDPSNEEQRLIIKDYLRTVTDVSFGQLEKLLRNGIDSLIDSILRIASDRIPIEVGRTYLEIENEIKALPYNSESLFEHAYYFGKLCDRQKNLKPDVERGLNLFDRFMQGENVNIVDSPLLLMHEENRLKRAPEQRWEFLQKAVPLVQELSDELLILARLCEGARKKLEKSETLQFEDLLIKMDQKVQESAFADKIRANYDAVLIDEFQDTNPIQWRIFKTLFSEKLLYLVGDPKQAIYRFRHADIYTYMEAKRSFGQTDVLNTNYRSTPSVVKKLNELFVHLEIALPKTGETIPYQPVHFDPSKADEGGVFHLQAETEEQLFVAILNRVELPLSGNAVLVKDRYQAERFLQFAKARGFSAVSRRARSLLDSPALPAARALFEALCHPHSRTAVLRVLGGPLYVWPIERLEEENPFFDYKKILEEKGLYSFFRAWTVDQGAALVERDEALYLDLLQLIEYLAEKQLPPEELIPYLDQMKEELPAHQNTEAEAIQVLTTHVSKGLEFDTVFPIGLIKSSPRKRELVCIDGRYRATSEHHPELDAEEMRQLYVAFTRAKKRLYILSLKEGKGPVNRLLDRAAFEPVGVDLEELRVPPKSALGKLHLPKETKKEWKPLVIDSFSSLFEHTPGPVKADPSGLPGGAEVGTFLHTLLEKLNFANYREELPPLLQQSRFSDHYDEIYGMIERALTNPLPHVGRLIDIHPAKMIKEMEFLYTTPNGYMKGFIDLFFEHEKKFYILDWKSNLLEDLETLMKRNHYDEQAKIYREAVKRYLEHFNRSFGGCFYLFLRGNSEVVFL